METAPAQVFVHKFNDPGGLLFPAHTTVLCLPIWTAHAVSAIIFAKWQKIPLTQKFLPTFLCLHLNGMQNTLN